MSQHFLPWDQGCLSWGVCGECAPAPLLGAHWSQCVLLAALTPFFLLFPPSGCFCPRRKIRICLMKTAGSFEHLVWTTCHPDIRYYRHHLAICITSLWTSSYYQKRHTLPVLCYICLNSLLVPPCWHDSQRAPLHLILPKGWGATACTPPWSLGPTLQLAPLSPNNGSSPSQQLQNR